ncbi:ROK family protein [Geochorda subterranea]|uniref:ROK family protein n=1 Tax=Geochorda subterranea TaxID=3109564 RepID=UPI0038600B2A
MDGRARGHRGRPGPRGARGLLESLIAGPALQATASRRLGEPLAPRDIFDRAARGDPACRAIVDEAREHLAWALANVVSLLNPALVLVGGSVGLRLAEQPERLEAAVRAGPSRGRPAGAIAPAGLGDDAGLLGAARAALTCVGG